MKLGILYGEIFFLLTGRWVLPVGGYCMVWAVEESRERSLTTLQAALIINTIVNMFGIAKLASAYLVQAIDIAHELGLFEPTTYITLSGGAVLILIKL
ncbi:hypothetical protein IWW34DRAFT_382195 [Fusarium oxysporum f. sp. albedinis]|nr:hypothetical protein IWW34DRAFT_382195 [Fusarium oxysporum f. sp. albedinis]